MFVVECYVSSTGQLISVSEPYATWDEARKVADNYRNEPNVLTGTFAQVRPAVGVETVYGQLARLH